MTLDEARERVLRAALAWWHAERGRMWQGRPADYHALAVAVAQWQQAEQVARQRGVDEP